MKNKNGEVLTKESDQRERWAEHFEEVLNREIPGVEIEEAAVGKMKSNKAAGVDNLVAEIYKVCEDESVTVLRILFGKIWEKEVVPDEWLKGIIVKLPKKGDLLDCNN